MTVLQENESCDSQHDSMISLVCSVCGLSDRERAAMHVLQHEFRLSVLSSVCVIDSNPDRLIRALRTRHVRVVEGRRNEFLHGERISERFDAVLALSALDETLLRFCFESLLPNGHLLIHADTSSEMDTDFAAHMDEKLCGPHPQTGELQSIRQPALRRLDRSIKRLSEAGFDDLMVFTGQSTGFGYLNASEYFITGGRPERGEIHRRRSSDISVVIPLYNHPAYIEETLDSVFRQTTPPAEIIIVDDGSTDNSYDVAYRVCKGMNNVYLWRQSNRGAHNTINAGIHRATRKLIAILNSDDIYLPSRLETCERLLEATDSWCVASLLEFIDGRSQPRENAWYEGVLEFWQESGHLPLSLLNGNFLMTTSNLVAQRKLFDRVGYFSSLRYCHDIDFFMRILRSGATIEVLPERLLSYRMHDTNTINENQYKVRAEWVYVLASNMVDPSPGLCAGLTTWKYLEQLNRIVERHGLERFALLVLQAWLGTRRIGNLDELLSDDDFKAAIYEET
jgi:glycosyltransferase involved in cell wall biosynthesis